MRKPARWRRALAVSFAVSILSLSPRAGHAQQPAPGDAAKTEARTRFDRGLALFNDGDNAGALAEFKRVYELIPNPLALYNVGLVYAAMGRPVESVDALDKVVANPGPVTG